MPIFSDLINFPVTAAATREGTVAGIEERREEEEEDGRREKRVERREWEGGG